MRCTSIGVLFLHADIIGEERGLLSRQCFLNPLEIDTSTNNIQMSGLLEGYVSRARSPSPALSLAPGQGVAKESQDQRALDTAQRHRVQEDRILSEYASIIQEVAITDDCLNPRRSGVTSVVPIKTYLTLLEFHFPISFATAVVDIIKAVVIPEAQSSSNLSDKETSTAIVPTIEGQGTAQAVDGLDPLPVYENPLLLLQCGYIVSKRYGRLLEHKYAEEYVKFCVQSMRHLQGLFVNL